MEYTTLDKISENLDSMRKPITSSDRTEGEIPYYGASGVVDSVKDYIFDEPLLLVSEDGANLLARSTPIAFSIDGKTWVNNHAHVLRFEDRNIQKYVEMYLNHISLEPYITGSAQPKLNQKKLNEIPIPVADHSTMVQAVATIEKIKAVIAQRKQELEKLDDLIKARFVELFGDLKETVRLGDCCDVHARIGWQALTRDEHMQTGEYMLVTGTDFCDGRVNYDTCVYVTKERYEMDSHIILKENDVLITKDGSIGKVAVVHDLPKPATLNGGVFVVRPDDRFNKEYISYVFRGPLFERFVDLSKTGATIKHLNQKHLVEFEIPLPSIEEQEAFAQFSKQIDKSKVAVQKSLDETQLLFDSLMQKYFG